MGSTFTAFGSWGGMGVSMSMAAGAGPDGAMSVGWLLVITGAEIGAPLVS